MDPLIRLVAEMLVLEGFLYLEDRIVDGNTPTDSNNLVENTLRIDYLKTSEFVNTLENSLS
jgi:hypothetical protein